MLLLAAAEPEGCALSSRLAEYKSWAVNVGTMHMGNIVVWRCQLLLERSRWGAGDGDSKIRRRSRQPHTPLLRGWHE